MLFDGGLPFDSPAHLLAGKLIVLEIILEK